MATLNDYKLVNQKAGKYFEFLLSELTPAVPVKKDKDKERFGFYLFILENLTGVKDFSDLIEMITDTDFNTRIYGEKFDDLGIDAIYINEEKHSIQLFNFKYKESFSSSRSQINEAIISSKFLNAMQTENLGSVKHKIKDKLECIIDRINSKEAWDLQLFIISNEDFDFEKGESIKDLERTYGLEVINIGLPQIANFFSIRPEPINAEIILEKDAIMSFSEDSLSSSKSYIIRLPLSEIIRMTCNNKDYRNEYNIEDISKLSDVKLDFGSLFDNVRGFVVKSKYNKNIISTLEREPTKFFIYNNGLTFIVSGIKTESVSANKKLKLKLENLQVVNGGQTLRSIHSFNQLSTENIQGHLSDAQVLVRIFNVSGNSELDNKIAEFTNSQNAISPIDLKSLREEQLQIEQYLSENNILYIRKSGDTGSEEKEYDKRISMERLGQILFSLAGFPEKATNQKKNIFDKYYNDLFINNLDISELSTIINSYFEIKNKYTVVDPKASEQKIFYILYLRKISNINEIEALISKFERCISDFTTEKELSDARKLIKSDFKVYIDKEFGIEVEV